MTEPTPETAAPEAVATEAVVEETVTEAPAAEAPAAEAAEVPADDEDAVNVVGAAVTDGAYALFVADFDDVDVAWQAYEALKDVEDGATVKVEGVIVVKRDEDGTIKIQKATDHSTAKGLGWGVLGGAILGIIFPPSIIASAATFGIIGAAVGKGVNVHHKSELADELESAIEPGHSAIVALVSDPGAVKIRQALAAANAIVQTTVDSVTAADLKAAAKQAEAEGEDAPAVEADKA